MTKITLFQSSGALVGFSVGGHSGYAEAGEDVVCSAVSAITQTAVLGLTEVMGLTVALEMDEASLYCMLGRDDMKGEQFRSAELILRTMAAGLRSIANTYGNFIRIIEREV